MTLADELERLLLRESDLSAKELYERLGRTQSKVRGADVVQTVLTMQPERFVERVPGRFASAKRVVAPEVAESAADPDSWRELETELRSQLRGRRMVSEIGLDAKLLAKVEEELSTILRPTTDPLVAADQCRALLAVCLVSHGIYRYEAGSYWTGFSVQAINQSYGKAFAKAIRLLELESFDEMVEHDNAIRYVAPILAHGGVPKYCLDDFFTLVTHGLRLGAADATDLMTLWRTRRAAFANIDTPVRRFLLFGGELSLDFLGRCLDVIREWSASGMLPTPQQAGLPAYVLSGFRKLAASGQINAESLRRRRDTSAALRPTLQCDPWDILGPCLVLPKVDQASPSAVWTISTPSGIRREPASLMATRSIPVEPARQWQVELTSNHEKVVDTAFEGIDEMPVMFFDSTTSVHIPPGLGLRDDEAIVLRPADKVVQVVRSGTAQDPTVLERLPEPTGSWSGFCLERIDLAGCSALTVGGGSDQRRITVRSVERPALDGQVLVGALGSDGSDVYAGAISLRLPASDVPWSIKVIVDGVADAVVGDGGSVVELAELLPDDRAARVVVTARAALGSDLRAAFTWVPGLSVSRPDRLALPHEPPPSVQVYSPSVPPLGAGSTDVLTVTPDGDSDSVDLLFPGSGDPVGVRVHLPRLRWGLVQASACELSTTDCRLTTLDFLDGQAPGLAISTGERDVPIELSISSNGRELQRSDKSRSAGARGQCRFDLARFSDTLGRLEERADLILFVGNAGVPVRVGTVLPEYEFSDLSVSGIHTGQHALVEVTFTEERHVKGRVARLWSVSRLWDEPVVAPIPNEDRGRVELYLDPAPPPGEYLVEVTIDDGFSVPQRPRGGDQGVVRWHLGDVDAALVDLRRRAESDPAAVIESIVGSGRPCRPLDPNELPAALEPALVSWVRISREDSRSGTAERALEALQHVLRRGRESLHRVIDLLAGDGDIESSDLLRLSIALAPLLAPSDGGVDSEGVRVVWQLEPALGALLELGAGESFDPANPTEFLGWSPAEPPEPILVGDPVEQRWLGMELQQLDMIRTFLQFDLLPRPLTVDGRVQAIFEWLRADKLQGGGLVSKWRSAHHQLLNRPVPISDDIRAHLDARSVPHGTEVWGAFPQLTLAAALHVCGRTDTIVPGQRALISAMAFAPLQVRRDLVLARILVLDLAATSDFDEFPTERIA